MTWHCGVFAPKARQMVAGRETSWNGLENRIGAVEGAPLKPEDPISSRAFDARILCVSQIQMFHIWLPSSSPLRGKGHSRESESVSTLSFAIQSAANEMSSLSKGSSH